MGTFSDFIEIFRFVDLFKTFRSAGKDDVEDLISILKYGKSKYSRWEAAEALGKIGDTRAVDLLIEKLKDKKLLVRWKAAEALGEIKDYRAVEPLIHVLNDKDEDWSVRKNAGAID
jgi:HEAT repeat protein